MACGVGITVAVEEWRAGAAAKVIDAADEPGAHEHDDEQLDYISLRGGGPGWPSRTPSGYASGAATAGYRVRPPLHHATARAAHYPTDCGSHGVRAPPRQVRPNHAPARNQIDASQPAFCCSSPATNTASVSPRLTAAEGICEVLVLLSLWTG